MNGLQTPYNLKREDSHGARFYWERNLEGGIDKFIGITSLAEKVIPKSEEVIRWKLNSDPDGRLLELAADIGTLMHICIDLFDRGRDWEAVIPPDYKYERMIKGAVYSWRVFCEENQVEVLDSELMLKWEKQNDRSVRFACALDKVVYLHTTEKVKVEVTDGFYKSGKRKGEVKTKTVITEKKVKRLAIIDLKSNVFEKEKKTFYEGHKFQLWGQRKALMQSFPELGNPLMFNWSPSTFRARKDDNTNNLYTFYQHSGDYEWQFNHKLEEAAHNGWLNPNGRVEIFFPFSKETPINECYKSFSYDEFIEYKEGPLALPEQ